jgi:hypothetical protein
MNKLLTGYHKLTINPPLGIGIAGYFVPRFAQGFLDDICASAFALACDDERVLIISVDACMLDTPLIARYCAAIEHATGIAKDRIFFTNTHTHTGPLFTPTDMFEAPEEPVIAYANYVEERLVELARTALSEMVPTKMGYGVGTAPARVAYIRRYKMKDGSTMTCPPINDPDIVGPIGELDQRVNVLRFDRENNKPFILVNYGVHVDTVNGDMLSADWPYWMAKTLDLALDGADCMFLCGAQGDVGSTNVHPDSADMNDTEISFDNEMKSPGMARFVGRALAGTVLQVYDKVYYTDVDSLRMITKVVPVKLNVPEPHEVPLAKKYKQLHEAGRDCDIPYTAMELTTVVAEALRICKYENSPAYLDLNMSGLRIGPVALVGIPGEPFTEVGVKIKDTEGFELILPCALTGGYEGYFPVKAAYDEGGYEARSSRYKSGVAETIVEGGKQIIAELAED